MKTIITNEELYHSEVISVDVNNVKNVTENSFYADVEIELIEGKKEFFGEFGYYEFETEFGFVFEK